MNEQIDEISPEKPTKLKNFNRIEIREKKCWLCNQFIGNCEFQTLGEDLICLDCSYEIGDGG